MQSEGGKGQVFRIDESFCCVIIDTNESTTKDSLNTIRQLGFEIVEKYEGTFHYNALERYEDLIVCKLENRLVLFGQCLHEISNKIVTHKDLESLTSNCLTLHMIYQDADEDSCFTAYFENGRPGPAHQVVGLKKKAWSRTFTQDQLPIPHSEYVNSSISELSDFLNAEYDLVYRFYRGMHGKGNYGVGYHPDKEKWVACKKGVVPDDSELQEIDDHNYRKKGKQFKRTAHLESHKSFYNQTELAYEIHRRAFRNLVDVNPDEFVVQDSTYSFEKCRVRFLE